METSYPNGKTNICILWQKKLIFLSNFLMFFYLYDVSCQGIHTFIHIDCHMSHIADFYSISDSNMCNQSESALRIFFLNLIYVYSNNYGIKTQNLNWFSSCCCDLNMHRLNKISEKESIKLWSGITRMQREWRRFPHLVDFCKQFQWRSQTKTIEQNFHDS